MILRRWGIKRKQMKEIYALLVGINDYPHPVSKLKGCLRDVQRIEHYLKGNDPELALENAKIKTWTIEGLTIEGSSQLNICKLLDADATYDNIVKAFRLFLRSAGPKDVVWFHFSGHGSEADTAKEFLRLEPSGKDQTIVCYLEQRSGGRLHLTDKEMAVLLHEVGATDLAGNPKESPHMLVSMDCCHSGSMTRNFGRAEGFSVRAYEAVRGIGGAMKPAREWRSLDTYLDGFYQKMWEEKKELEIPLSTHLSISACNSLEKAGDLPLGGIFTTSLAQAIEESQGQINYSDLYARTKSTSKAQRNEQSPQFEPIGNFNPFTKFLDGAVFGLAHRYNIEYDTKNRHWRIQCGAIHGLPLPAKGPITIAIRSFPPADEFMGEAQLAAIGALDSEIIWPESLPLHEKEMFQGEIRFFPAEAVYVKLTGTDEEAVTHLKKVWGDSLNIKIATPETAAEALWEVEAQDGDYRIWDIARGRIVYRIKQLETGVWNGSIVVGNLAKIVKWQRLLRLGNTQSALPPQLDLQLTIQDNTKQSFQLAGPEVNIYFSEEAYYVRNPVVDMRRMKLIGCPIRPDLILQQPKTNLHCYLLQLTEKFAIISSEDPKLFQLKNFESEKEVIFPLWTGGQGLFLEMEKWNSTSHFKLIVTTRAIKHEQFLQTALGNKRAMRRRGSRIVEKEDDWCSLNIQVNLIQELGEINSHTALQLAEGNLIIQPHPALKAKLCLVEARPNAPSQNPSQQFHKFQDEGIELLNIDDEKGVNRAQVLELKDLKWATTSAKPEIPLALKLKHRVGADEVILPIGFDGQDFHVIGHAEATPDGTAIFINTFDFSPSQPVGQNQVKVENPFDPTDLQHCSLYQTYKLAFFKVKRSLLETNSLPWITEK